MSLASGRLGLTFVLMRWWPAVLVLSCSMVALAQPASPDCISSRGEARWGADAYNHIVRIENACTRAALCEVSTDVNPQVQRVTVPAGEVVEVMTFRGSPASQFTPTVSCQLR